MKLKNDVRTLIGRFFILVVSVTSNKSIVSHISSSEVYRMFTVFRSDLLLFLVKVGKKRQEIWRYDIQYELLQSNK